jgi:hypothetical protein
MSVDANNLMNTTVSSAGNSVSPQDMQTRMMMMMTESFAKLSTAFAEGKIDPKAEWPKFSGDAKKFRAWYLGITSQLSLPPWLELYDSSKNDVVESTSNNTLNGKLYSKIVLALEGQAYKNFISRKHLRANGLLLLQELVQTYKPRNVPEIIAAKTVEFWGSMKRQPSESIDSYYDRFHELLEDLEEADEPIAQKAAIRQFIFTLGPEFESIQNNFRINNLPSKWSTQNWPQLLTLCRDYYNSVKPKISTNRIQTNTTDGQFDREAHQKKVKSWFMNPVKFCQEIEREQNCHPGKCIYHLAKSHPTEKCGVKIECDEILAERKKSKSPTPSTSATTTTGQIRHITEEQFVDTESEEIIETMSDNNGNDTNDDALYYFARLSNHYLRLVKSSNQDTLPSRHTMRYPVIADSGANFHMFRDKEFFENIIPATGTVLLGDGHTSLKIQGIGTVKCKIGKHILTIEGVQYIPDLAESIYSLFVHVKTSGHGLSSSFEQGLFIKFPDFDTKAILGRDDLYIDAVPIFMDTDSSDSDQKVLSTEELGSHPLLCRNITEFQNDLVQETQKLDNILRQLRHYYHEIKTKCQLGLNVPASFRSSSVMQNTFREFTPPHRSKSINLQQDQQSIDVNLLSSMPEGQSNVRSSLDKIETSSTPSSEMSIHEPSDTSIHVPIIRSVDKVSSSLPSKILMSEDFIRSSVGFRRIDTMRKHFSSLYSNNIMFDNTPADAFIDAGDLATLRKKDRNTVPVSRPLRFADVIHIDIVFGPEVSIGNIHYGLLFTDRFSRMTYIYPLHNLTTDIKKQMESFFAHIGVIPKRIVSDFDTKLIGGQAREYLNSLLIHVNAAPSNRQDKNGLVERHWQTMVSMARNWLASAELPSSFTKSCGSV